MEVGLADDADGAGGNGHEADLAAAAGRFGYRQILIVNKVCIGITMGMFALVKPSSPLALIVMLGLMQGFFNSLQFSSMDTRPHRCPRLPHLLSRLSTKRIKQRGWRRP